MNIKSISMVVLISGIIALSSSLFSGGAGTVPSEEWNMTFGGAQEEMRTGLLNLLSIF